MYGARSGAQKGLPAGRRNVACRARVDYDGSNGPYFNNDKSPWFDATTDTAGLGDLTVRYHRQGSISWLLSYRWSCPLLDPRPYRAIQHEAPLKVIRMPSFTNMIFSIVTGMFLPIDVRSYRKIKSTALFFLLHVSHDDNVCFLRHHEGLTRIIQYPRYLF